MANPIHYRSEAAAASDDAGSDTTLGQPGESAESATLLEAQSKAREWADRALELEQAGDPERARVAEVHAELWLARMLRIETMISGEPRLARAFRRPPPVRRKMALAIRTPRPDRSEQDFDSAPVMDQATVANSVMLRCWKRA